MSDAASSRPVGGKPGRARRKADGTSDGDGTRRVGEMELPTVTIEDVIKRLRRVEGQVRGIQQMIDDGRDCRDVVTQIAAANKALEQVGFVLVSAGLTWCVSHPAESAAAGYDLGDVQKMFLKLA